MSYGEVDHCYIAGRVYALRVPYDTVRARQALVDANVFSTPIYYGKIGFGGLTGQHLVQAEAAE